MSDPGAISLPGVLKKSKKNMESRFDGGHFHCILKRLKREFRSRSFLRVVPSISGKRGFGSSPQRKNLEYLFGEATKFTTAALPRNWGFGAIPKAEEAKFISPCLKPTLWRAGT